MGVYMDETTRFQELLLERVASCEDYLGRVKRSITGEIPRVDTFYVREKARALLQAAEYLLLTLDKVEEWATQCGRDVEWVEGDGTRYADECRLPKGHSGPCSWRRPE